jgi:hypothetical protein
LAAARRRHCMFMEALIELMPEAVLLSAFPFIFYWFTRPLPTFGAKVAIAVVCFACYVLVVLWYAILEFGRGTVGGSSYYPSDRWDESPLQVAVLLIGLPMSAAVLAAGKRGTLGQWTFAIGTGFISFWAGQGWLPAAAEMDWRFVIAAAVVGGLCGAAAGSLVSRASQPQGRSGKILLWSLTSAGSAALGMLVSWPAVQSVVPRMEFNNPRPLDLRPFSIDPWAIIPQLLLVVIIWLILSTFFAITTGYIKLHRRWPAPGAAPE